MMVEWFILLTVRVLVTGVLKVVTVVDSNEAIFIGIKKTAGRLLTINKDNSTGDYTHIRPILDESPRSSLLYFSR